jgi:hypothetical protein
MSKYPVSEKADLPPELVMIMGKLDPSVHQHFDRCADSTWLIGDSLKTSDITRLESRNVTRNVKTFRKSIMRHRLRKMLIRVSRLVSLKNTKKIHRQLLKKLKSREEKSIHDQILMGSNTPNASRPSSVIVSTEEIVLCCKRLDPVDKNESRGLTSSRENTNQLHCIDRY